MKRPEKLRDVMELIDEKYIEEAEQAVRHDSPSKKRRIVLRRVLIAAAVAAVVGATAFMIPAMIKGRGTTPPAGTSVQSETETDVDTGIETGHKETDQKPGPMGGTDVCTVHPFFCYHWFPQTMIEIVGEDLFNEWMESAEKVTPTSDCRYPEANVYAFIRHFNIPRSEFEEQYYNSSLYYSTLLNFDVLYDDDPVQADEYYRDLEYFNGVLKKREAFSCLKCLIRESNPDKWIETFGNDQITPQTSVKAAVNAFGLSREDIEHIIEESSKTIDAVYDYNIDALFDGSMDGLTPIEQDALFCGITDPMTE